jgi:hypothetical protein
VRRLVSLPGDGADGTPAVDVNLFFWCFRLSVPFDPYWPETLGPAPLHTAGGAVFPVHRMLAGSPLARVHEPFSRASYHSMSGPVLAAAARDVVKPDTIDGTALKSCLQAMRGGDGERDDGVPLKMSMLVVDSHAYQLHHLLRALDSEDKWPRFPADEARTCVVDERCTAVPAGGES